MVNKPVSARHHLASLALAVLATFSTSIHAQATISAGDTTYRGSFTTDAKTGAVNGTGTVQWKSGNRYEGPVVNTQLTGKGSFIWANGDTYVGDMMNAQPHGQGTYTFKSGDRYAGAWRNGQKHGQGRYTFANGTVWEGEFANDQQFKPGAVAVAQNALATPAPASEPAATPVASPAQAPVETPAPTAATATTTPPAPLAQPSAAEAPWVGKRWEVRRATDDVWRTPTWVFNANGTAEATGLWKGIWSKLPNGRVQLKFITSDGKASAYEVEFSPTTTAMTLYRDGAAQAYGRTATAAETAETAAVAAANISASTTTTSPSAQSATNREELIFNQLAALFDVAAASKVPPRREELDNLFAKADYFSGACFLAIYKLVADTVQAHYRTGEGYVYTRAFSVAGGQNLKEPDYVSKLNGFSNIKLSAQQKTKLENRRSIWDSITKESLQFVPNTKCDRVFVRNFYGDYDKGQVRWTLSYADMRYSFLSSQNFGVLTSRKFEHLIGYPNMQQVNDFGESLADSLTLSDMGVVSIILAPRGYEVQQKDWGIHIQNSGSGYFELGPLTAELQHKYPTKFRSQDDWPTNEKAMLATWESARAKEKARQEAQEAKQARLAAIESEKRRKQEQARFDAAMGAKDPQAMYLAAGKYEREGDSYNARKLYEQLIDRFPSSPFAAKANDQLLANQRSDKARSDLFDAQRDAQRQQGEAAYKACMVQSDACYKRNNSFKGCTLPSDCNSLR